MQGPSNFSWGHTDRESCFFSCKHICGASRFTTGEGAAVVRHGLVHIVACAFVCFCSPALVPAWQILIERQVGKTRACGIVHGIYNTTLACTYATMDMTCFACCAVARRCCVALQTTSFHRMLLLCLLICFYFYTNSLDGVCTKVPFSIQSPSCGACWVHETLVWIPLCLTFPSVQSDQRRTSLRVSPCALPTNIR